MDSKIKFMVETAYQKALTILKANKDLMEKLSSILFEKEYLSKEEFELIMNASGDEVDAIVETMRAAYRKELEAIEKK
ncbi:hypothetical protein KA478_03690 [Patescibacteria group bacterium]|nr:hypothetical protein [Patescibacteria group bacterium]